MDRLFVQLYLDEDVIALVAKLLRARGFTITTTPEAHLAGRSDREQLSYAVNHEMTLLTHNRADFELLARQYFNQGRKHPGIIIAVRRSPFELVRRLLILLDEVSADEMESQLRYV